MSPVKRLALIARWDAEADALERDGDRHGAIVKGMLANVLRDDARATFRGAPRMTVNRTSRDAA